MEGVACIELGLGSLGPNDENCQLPVASCQLPVASFLPATLRKKIGARKNPAPI